MVSLLGKAYDRVEDARPLVRPTYNEYEIALLPPFGDPEVSIPGELCTYASVGVVTTAVVEYLD